MNICVGEDSCNSQTTKEGSESVLLAATLRSPFVPQTKALKQCHKQKVEKCNRLSSGPAHALLSKSNHVRKCSRLSPAACREPGDEANRYHY